MIEWWDALRKVQVMTAFAKRFQTTSFRKSYWWISLASAFQFFSLWAERRLWKLYSKKRPDHCRFRWVVYNSYFEKGFLINFISTYSKLLKHFIFARFLLIEDYEQSALQKELIFAPFVEGFKTATLGKASW